ncbi:hypothetical protein O5560_27455, partial [Escherichia coli]|nr:hypothetical protein [Escherichia coli]
MWTEKAKEPVLEIIQARRWIEARMTPAVRHNDGLDYVPTDKKVLFGHHFAAIAGAGPLVVWLRLTLLGHEIAINGEPPLLQEGD